MGSIHGPILRSLLAAPFRERIVDFAKEFDSQLVFDCDVSSDAQIEAMFEQLGTAYMKRGTERYAPTDPQGYKYAGRARRGFPARASAPRTRDMTTRATTPRP